MIVTKGFGTTSTESLEFVLELDGVVVLENTINGTMVVEQEVKGIIICD